MTNHSPISSRLQYKKKKKTKKVERLITLDESWLFVSSIGLQMVGQNNETRQRTAPLREWLLSHDPAAIYFCFHVSGWCGVYIYIFSWYRADMLIRGDTKLWEDMWLLNATQCVGIESVPFQLWHSLAKHYATLLPQAEHILTEILQNWPVVWSFQSCSISLLYFQGWKHCWSYIRML